MIGTDHLRNMMEAQTWDSEYIKGEISFADGLAAVKSLHGHDTWKDAQYTNMLRQELKRRERA